MSESSGKRRNRYVYYLKDIFKIIFLVHGPGHSSDECKVLVDFSYKYSKIGPTEDCRHDPTTKGKNQTKIEQYY